MPNTTPISPPPAKHRTRTLQPRTPPSKDTSKVRLHRGYSNTTPLPSHHTQPESDNDHDQFPFPTDSPVHFSPSKARAAARQTQELAALKRWLATTILSPEPATSSSSSRAESTATSSLPSSRHDQSDHQLTLLLSRWETEHRSLGTSNAELAAQMTQWLQEVMSANRLADERRRLVFEARREELDRVVTDGQAGPKATARELLREVYSMLSDRGREAVDSLAESTVLVGHVPEVDGTGSIRTELGQAVMETTLRAQDLQSHIQDLQSLLLVLQKQLKKAEDQLASFREEEEAAAKGAESMHPQTVQWTSETKQIAIKIKEYQDRISALTRGRPGTEMFRGVKNEFVSIEDVIEAQQRLNSRRSAIAKLEERMGAFSGLPPDLELSREEVQRARLELHTLKARREELFRLLAERQ